MRPEGEAQTSQPTPEEETDQIVRSTRRVLWGSSLVVGVTTQKDSTQQCPAQPDKGWGTEGLHYGKTGAVVSCESGSPSFSPSK